MSQFTSIFVKDGKAQKQQRRNGHVLPQAPLIPLDQPGRLRVCHLMALFGIAHSTVYKREADGTIPPRDGNDGRPWWHTGTIFAYLETGQVIITLCPPAGKDVPNATLAEDLSIASATPLPAEEMQ